VQWVLAGWIAFVGSAGVMAVADPGSDADKRASIDSTTTSVENTTTTSTTEPAPDAAPGSVMVAAVGDIVCSPNHPQYKGGAGTSRNCRAMATQAVALGLHPDLVLLLGDIQYECGAAAEWVAFANSWGSFGELLHPAIGNHEFGRDCDTDDASGYFDYFGAGAGDAGHGWYSFDAGDWHLIALNSECSYGGGSVGGCGVNSAQRRWLLDDLAAHPAQCTLAFWHEPRFSSGQHGNATQMSVLWNDLASAGADVVLAGHNHDYERFEPIGVSSTDPVVDPNGIRSFVVGTGGKNLTDFIDPPLPGQAVRDADTYGVLGLRLRSGGYDWQFVPVDGGGGFTDAGSGACH
jgi:hypothetical protein